MTTDDANPQNEPVSYNAQETAPINPPSNFKRLFYRKTVVTKGKRKAADLEECDSNLVPAPTRISSTSQLCEKTVKPKYESFNTDSKRVYTTTQQESSMLSPKEETGVDRRTIDFFFDHVLPPIRPEFDIDRMFDFCIKNKTLKKSTTTDKYYWEGLSECSKDARSHEHAVSTKPFIGIFDAVTKAAQETSSVDTSPTTFLYAGGNDTIQSNTNIDSDIIPDAQLCLHNYDDTYPESLDARIWYNNAISFHMNKNNTERVLRSLRHCMFVDHCRRFTLGATIEDTRMRLWVFNRSTIMASESFNYNNDPLTMIKVVLSVVFADKIDLGWDPTLAARYNGSEREFTFDISGNHFRTTSSNVISDIKANMINTAGTRIYRAFRDEDIEEKEPVIIKDFWPSENNETEDVIRQKILASLADDIERELVEGLTLTPIMSGRVKVKDQDDHTRMVILRGLGPKATYRIPLPNEEFLAQNYSVKTSEGFTYVTNGQHRGSTLRLEGNRTINQTHRWHYRIVFKEVAIPYHKLRGLNEMGYVLYCAVTALRCIHKARWVHRDLSPGNLYLYIDRATMRGRGLIGDLEFAKQVGTGGTCDIRTGTPDFMAIEVTKRSTRFKQRQKTRIKFDANFEDNVKKRALMCRRGIWANYIHDLESIWWIAVWTLFNFQNAFDSNSESKDHIEMTRKQALYLSQIFRGTMDNSFRQAFFEDDAEFWNIADVPNSLQTLKTAVMSIRNSLLKQYIAEGRKGSNPVILTDEGSLHDEIIEALKPVMRDKTLIAPIKIKPLFDTKPTSTSKCTAHSTGTDDQPAKRARLEGSGESGKVNSSSTLSPSLLDSLYTNGYASALGVINEVAESIVQDKEAGEGTNAIAMGPHAGDKQDDHDSKISVTIPELAKDKEPRKTVAIPRKTRSGSGIKRKKTKIGTSSPSPKPTTRRTKKAILLGKEPIHPDNRRVTRSMTKKATEGAENKDPEPSSSKRTPEARVTRSRSKAAAAAKKPQRRKR